VPLDDIEAVHVKYSQNECTVQMSFLAVAVFNSECNEKVQTKFAYFFRHAEYMSTKMAQLLAFK
jgi:hypothetical protein